MLTRKAWWLTDGIICGGVLFLLVVFGTIYLLPAPISLAEPHTYLSAAELISTMPSPSPTLVWVELGSVSDTWLDADFPLDNYYNTGFLKVKKERKRPLLRFDLAEIPRTAYIQTAKLRVHMTTYSSEPSLGLRVEIYGLRHQWTERETNWISATREIRWAMEGADDPSRDREANPVATGMIKELNVPYEFDITPLVRQWLAYPSRNYGVIFIGRDNWVEYRFWSREYGDPLKRPLLRIGYWPEPSHRYYMHLPLTMKDHARGWTLSGLKGLAVKSLAVDPQGSLTAYAGVSGGGVYVQRGCSATWEATSLAGISVYALLVAPDGTVYAGTYGDGVRKSTNKGLTWSAVNQAFRDRIYALAMDPGNPSVIYAGTDDHGVFKSSDGGVTWSQANLGLGSYLINSLAVSHQYGGTLYVGTFDRGVYKSTDGAAFWTPINAGLEDMNVWGLAVSYSDPEVVYAATDSGVYKSSPPAHVWERTALTAKTFSLLTDARRPQFIIAGTDGEGVYASADGGASGIAVNEGLGDLVVQAIALNMSDNDCSYAYAGTSGGVWRKSLASLLQAINDP